MSENNQVVTVKKKVEKPVYKFLIGFIGGFTAAVFPRIVAALTLQDGSEVELLSVGYLSIAVLFGILIGAVVMIIEWGVPKEPGATFMTALGVPALLAGALNTSNGAHMLETKTQENIKLTEAVRSLSDIPEVSINGFTPLTDNSGTVKSSHSMSFNIIGVAHAETSVSQQDSFNLNPTMKIVEKQYYIILEEVTSEATAKQREAEIKPDVPNAQAVKSGDRYFIIDSKAKPKSKAVLESIQLQKLGFSPGLLEKK